MNCYLENCLLDALGTEDCFAYCSREHKAKVVMVDYDPEKQKPRNIKEIQLGLKKLGKQATEIEKQKKGQLL